MVYFSWIPRNNTRLKLYCKFGESKCNPYWDITLKTSHGTNYILNEHLAPKFYPTWPLHNTIWENIVIQLFCKFQESNWNPDWFIALMNSFDTYPQKKKKNGQHAKYNTIPDNVTLQLSCKFGASIWNHFWLILLTRSSDSNHVPNEHEDVDQYNPYAIPSEIMPC